MPVAHRLAQGKVTRRLAMARFESLPNRGLDRPLFGVIVAETDLAEAAPRVMRFAAVLTVAEEIAFSSRKVGSFVP